VTILFSIYIRQQHFHVAEYLPSRSAMQQDLKRSPDELKFLVGSYLQPELKADRDVWPDTFGDENPYEKPSTIEEGEEEE
jgi:hypothetical protein